MGSFKLYSHIIRILLLSNEALVSTTFAHSAKICSYRLTKLVERIMYRTFFSQSPGHRLRKKRIFRIWTVSLTWRRRAVNHSSVACIKRKSGLPRPFWRCCTVVTLQAITFSTALRTFLAHFYFFKFLTFGQLLLPRWLLLDCSSEIVLHYVSHV